MATALLFLSTSTTISRGINTANQRGTNSNWRAYAMSTASYSGSSSTSLTVTTITGTTAGLEFGSPLAEWISPPLAAATISGNVLANFGNTYESSMSANATIALLCQRLDSTGAIVSTVFDASYGTELGTSGGFNYNITPTSTTLAKGDRLRFVPYTKDATGTTMGSGYTITFSFGSLTYYTYAQFTETLTVLSEAASPFKTYLTSTASDIADQGATVDELELWTTRGTD